MLPKDISTRIMNQEIPHQLKTDAQKTGLKLQKRFKSAKTSSRFKEHLLVLHRRSTQTKQPKPRTRIMQLTNITSTSRRRI